MFVDFKQAYDLVNRAALWQDLQHRVGVPPPLLQAISALYDGDQYVLVDGPDKRTAPVHPTHGVKQGCPLSPMLFSLFISDVSAQLEAAAGPDRVPGAAGPSGGSLSHLLFADDLTLLSVSEACMHRLLAALSRFCQAKGMIVNVLKTKAMAFSGGGNAEPPAFVFNGQPIEVVEEFAYLGLLFTTKLGFKPMAKRWETSLRAGCVKAFALAEDRNVRRNPRAVLILLQTFGFPCMMHGCQIWGAGFLSDSCMFTTVLQQIYSRAVRRALGAPHSATHLSVFQEAGVPPLQFYWLRACVSFWNTCVGSRNPIVRTAVLGELALLAARKRSTWLYQVNAALTALNALGNSFTVSSPDGLEPMPVPVDSVMLAWSEKWERIWHQFPPLFRADDVDHRRSVVYRAHFLPTKPSSFELPAYLQQKGVPWRAVRSLTRFRLGLTSLRAVGYTNFQALFPQRVCRRCPCAWRNINVDDEHCNGTSPVPVELSLLC